MAGSDLGQPGQGIGLEHTGKLVGHDYFTPGWTAYDKRVNYLTYDEALAKPQRSRRPATLQHRNPAISLEWRASGLCRRCDARGFARASDVTDLLQSGENVLGAIVSPGWYAGRLGWERRSDQVNGKLELRAQLEVETSRGRQRKVLTGKDWIWHEGPHRAADFYDGEHYDARKELADLRRVMGG